MTDRVHSLTVVLKHDYRTDDVENIMAAIRMISGVISVDASIANPDSWMAESRAKNELRKKLWELLKDA